MRWPIGHVSLKCSATESTHLQQLMLGKPFHALTDFPAHTSLESNHENEGVNHKAICGVEFWFMTMRGALSALPTASGPWIWQPPEDHVAPVQESLF